MGLKLIIHLTKLTNLHRPYIQHLQSPNHLNLHFLITKVTGSSACISFPF